MVGGVDPFRRGQEIAVAQGNEFRPRRRTGRMKDERQILALVADGFGSPSRSLHAAQREDAGRLLQLWSDLEQRQVECGGECPRRCATAGKRDESVRMQSCQTSGEFLRRKSGVEWRADRRARDPEAHHGGFGAVRKEYRHPVVLSNALRSERRYHKGDLRTEVRVGKR